MSTESTSTPYSSIPWAHGDDVQCEDHDWAPDDHDGARIHVCGLVSGHDGKCVCVDCMAEFDGGSIQDDRFGANDMVGRPWNDGGAA